MQPTRVLDMNGQQVGTYRRSVDTPDGGMMLIERAERLGGGTIVVPAREASETDGAWRLPYGELSMREAPPYSLNVDLHAYSEFWKRLGAGNLKRRGDRVYANRQRTGDLRTHDHCPIVSFSSVSGVCGISFT